MSRLFSLGLEVFSGAIVVLPVLLLYAKMYHYNLRTFLNYLIFVLYLTAVYAVVGLPTAIYFRIDLDVNIMPFLDMINDFKNAVLNIILFLPLGIMLPLLWEKFRNPRSTFLFGMGMTLLIEFLQLFTYRTTDINDILTNIAGTMAGYFIANRLIRQILQITAANKKEREAYLLCVIAFFVMFFVQPSIAQALWELAY